MTKTPQSPTVLVTGATGGVGRHVVAGLIERDVSVRALVRDVATASLPAGVDVVAGDLADPKGLDGALEGTDAVFLLWPFFSAEGVAAVVDAITSSPRRVVYLSAQAAAHDSESFWAFVERRSSTRELRRPSCDRPGSRRTPSAGQTRSAPEW